MKALLLPALGLAFCAAASAAAPATAARQTIGAASMFKHMSVLASDDYEGRGLGGKGEQLSIEYIRDEFARLGLKPGGPQGSWYQAVPLVGVTSRPTLRYQGKGGSTELNFPADFVARSWRTAPEVQLQHAELVFVGYGVQAPEFKWDDYKGLDVKGKILVMLINDPQVPDPKDPSKLDKNTFGGSAMSYYGRWTYKYEIAAKLGAAGALIVHETKPAAYPWEVVKTGNATEGFMIKHEGDDPNNPTVPGWLHLDAARAMFKAAGLDYDQLKAAASRRDFKPVPLQLTADITVRNTWREFSSNNVIGMIEGSDPKLKDEVVLYSAHWDHFGLDPQLPGPRPRQIYHGAQDNASGVAALLELARAYASMPVKPKRSIAFFAPTAEERGLLGAYYYAEHPLFPLAKTRININMDMMNVLGVAKDVEISGYGRSTVDDWVAKVARSQGRKVTPANSETGLFFRSDHFALVKRGVPALFIESGTEFEGHPHDYKQRMNEEYKAHIYHKVDDVVHADWDLRGMVKDVELLWQVGYDVAQGKFSPQWKAGSEFKAAHDKLMQGGAQ
ncbi:M28 family peptidase [Massilia sp. TS11]|uniref:M28 family peptidase n=1 Tax=Massilia sp. TS11 TaxID=2908003 RepID=UPI001EDC1483|nr:M20/M25/M40 family metallo-hydrolase [Massilia sp. TS11]MCG2586632.1 M28 family peptidase [Massilia sp. TS11]